MTHSSLTAQQNMDQFPYLKGLNDKQLQAATTIDGPLLVLAGAGTGKTRVLTTRIAHILMLRKAQPHNILAVTFTNKAAKEMKTRVVDIVGPFAESVWLGTFHSVCVKILRRYAERVKLKSDFTILDQDDQIRLMEQVLEAAHIDTSRFPPRMVHAIIQRWKDRGLSPDKVPVQDLVGELGPKLGEMYKQYQDRLIAFNSCDFGDLLMHCLTLFQECPDVLSYYQGLFHYILVDEYQDTNVAQYLWLRLLAMGSGNICCVGDDDQSIYSWRGAEVDNILRFDKDFPAAQTIRLEQNYRSTGPILAAASELISRNKSRLGKTLWTESKAGEDINVRYVFDEKDEARFVAEEIEAKQIKGIPLNNMAILVRAGFQTRAFEERFLTSAIPYRIIGGLRFYERLEIRDAMAYFRLIMNRNDDLAFERIINTPKRGIGKTTVQRLYELARQNNSSLFDATLYYLQHEQVRPQLRISLKTFTDNILRWRARMQDVSHYDLAWQVLDESGYTDMLKGQNNLESQGRLENLKELCNAIKEMETLPAFLEHVSLVTDNESTANTDMVNIMTLHSAKGLEYDLVFLPGWEEGIFPHQKALDEEGLKGLEEERRLAYVGITRARKRVYISHASRRQIYGRWQPSLPSRFLQEIPEDIVETISEVSGFSFATMQDDAASSFQAPWAKGPSGGLTVTVKSTRVEASPFRAGVQVNHKAFGKGIIKTVEGDNLEIIFASGGIKKIKKNFVELA